MLRAFLIFLFSLLFSSGAGAQYMLQDKIELFNKPANSTDNSTDNAKIIKIVGFGDNLMSGYKLGAYRDYISTLERRLWQERYSNIKVYKYSSVGQTTGDALKKLQAIIDIKPNVVIIELGLNDAIQKIPLKTTYDNLTYIIENLQKNNIQILLMGMKAPPLADSEYKKQFPAMYSYLANKYKILLYKFFLKEVAGNEDLTLSDKIHPNQKGVTLMVENTLPYVTKLIQLSANN
jgi:acyl-CoA thioesterase-1